jgi:3-O-methylgallate 3,4-dioxygenase
MAEIVLGMAVPHGPMLRTPPEQWTRDGDRDRSNIREMWYRKRLMTFPEVVKERAGENFNALCTLEEWTARHARCQVALEKMRQAYLDARVDVAVILGKDQQEIFVNFSPSLAIYTGTEIYNGPPGRPVYAPDKWMVHEGHPQLALHLVNTLQAQHFDLMDLFKWLPNTWLENTLVVPHAYGFVLHQIMNDQPPPCVPILMNTFYRPTQPPIRRCIEFGKALTKAISSWKSDLRVAVIASGGLTHFVCDEQQDREFIELLGNGDLEGLANIDERIYQAGTSEMKLYVPVLIAAQHMGVPMTLVDYVPLYRTEAGTGEGMGFFHWSPVR